MLRILFGFASYLRTEWSKVIGAARIPPSRFSAGASIDDVAALLGYSSLVTTARYFQRLEGDMDYGWQGIAVILGIEGQAEFRSAG